MFIVEGISDQTALAVPLTNVFKQYTALQDVRFEITHGDITSKLEITPGNIIAHIGNTVRNFMKQFVNYPYYTENEIYVSDKRGIKKLFREINVNKRT